MADRKSIETWDTYAVAVLLALLAISASGCSRKAEECAAVEPLAASVRTRLDVDVTDDKQAAKRDTELASLLESVTSVRAALDKSPATDKDVRARSASYNQALGELVTKTNAVTTLFKDLSNAADAVAARAAADQSVRKARKEFFGSCDVADLEMLARGTEAYERSHPPKLAEMADAIEKMKFSNDKAMAAALPYAKAIREKGAVLKDGKDLDAKLKEVEEKSASTRQAFATARSSVQKADSALTETCAVVR